MGLGMRERMAKRAAEEISNGNIVNLGIGIPTLVSDFISNDVHVFLHSENGLLGIGPKPQAGSEDENLINAGGYPCTAVKGASYFDSAESFAIIRRGKLDISILGALEVDEKGNLANWIVPGKLVPGMGGGMDLAEKAKRVVVVTSHVNKNGSSKIKKTCSLPLTSKTCVKLIITDLAVIEVTKTGLILREIFEGTTAEEVITKTEADLMIDDDIRVIRYE